jgi:hypothetical protein
VERLFRTHQLLIASNFFEERTATIGTPPKAHLERADASPVPLSTMAEERGVLPRSPDAGEKLAAVGPQRGSPADQRPEAMRSGALADLQSQLELVAGILCRRICSISSGTSRCFSRRTAKRARWWRAINSSAPLTKRLSDCSRAADVLGRWARRALNAATSSGTRRVRARVSAWCASAARCGERPVWTGSR